MSEKRLFERLNDLDLTDDQRRVRALKIKHPAIESVKEHLVCVFNTRRGSVLLDSSYGVPDFSIGPGDGSPNAELIAKVLIETVIKYEPRLLDVEVDVNVGHDEAIHCVLKGKVKENKRILSVQLNGRIQIDGAVTLDEE